jgi:hypothetical protein
VVAEMTDELHVVRTDVLLWALGGLADPERQARDRRIAIIKGYAVRPKHSWPHGSRLHLSQLLGYPRDSKSFGMQVARVRRGMIGSLWRDVPPMPESEIVRLLGALA